MRRTHLTLAMGASLLLAAPAALANDSIAELRTGGLVLTRTEDIEMRSEDLFISPAEVRVRYQFLNTAPTDRTVLVAFPMPDIGGETFFQSDVAIPDLDSANLLAFRTTVDGRPVQARVEQKAFADGVEISAYLTGLRVPLAPQLPQTGAALDRLPAATRAELVRRGLARVEEFDAGQGLESHLSPLWVLKTTFYWEQTFPAGRELSVEHRYKPSVGGTVQTLLGSSYATAADEAAERKRYCADDAFMAGVRKRWASGEAADVGERRIAYVLKTGANWRKPIGDFRMVIDKGSPANLVSFCAEGVRKISPTQFEVRRRNFTPTRDLDILIVGRAEP